MDEYSDSKGNQYHVSGRYLVGDLVILSEQHLAYKMSSATLSQASPVFRDMLAISNSNPKEVTIPDASNLDISYFLEAICDFPKPEIYDWRHGLDAIALLLKFECVDAAKRLLYRAVEELQAEDLFRAFALASQMDDLITGCRILTQGYRWYQADPRPDQPSLAPGSGQRPWKAVDAAQVRSSWVWALTLGFTECAHRPVPDDKTGKRFAKPHYWRDVVGAFMANLTR